MRLHSKSKSERQPQNQDGKPGGSGKSKMNALPREVSQTGEAEQALISAIVSLVEKGLSREVS
ncbi:hypothetical protein AO203_08045 [Lactobacillus gallinarum]|nr:hypothetical protein AO203_08045 [Lactobacillus gallinarum]